MKDKNINLEIDTKGRFGEKSYSGNSDEINDSDLDMLLEELTIEEDIENSEDE